MHFEGLNSRVENAPNFSSMYIFLSWPRKIFFTNFRSVIWKLHIEICKFPFAGKEKMRVVHSTSSILLSRVHSAASYNVDILAAPLPAAVFARPVETIGQDMRAAIF